MNKVPSVDKTIEMIKSDIPNFEVRFKNRDTLQKIIGWIMFFNRDYMTNYTTTLYPRVYFPSEASVERVTYYRTLCHEYVHLKDRLDHGVWFSFSYLFPQNLAILALLSVLSFISLQFLWTLLFLLFLAPLPAYFRTHWELRGYTSNLYITYLVSGKFDSYQVSAIKDIFLSWGYYRMCWSENKINKHIDLIKKKIEDGTVEEGKEGHVFKRIGDLHRSSNSNNEGSNETL